jgi:predicted metalloprotease
MKQLLTLQVPGYEGEIGAPEGIPTGGLSEGSGIAQWAITFLFIGAIVVALFMLIYSGIQWIMSGGDKQKVESARHRIIYAIIGLVVVFLSFMIINVIGTIFGVNLLGLSNNSPTGSNRDQREERVQERLQRQQERAESRN